MRSERLKKVYYSIREVAEITGVEPHVLRFWEKEFSTLRPRRSRSGNRTYKERDIEIVQQIKCLLWEQKYTIQGACEQLKRDRRDGEPQGELTFPDENAHVLGELRECLLEVKRMIGGPGPAKA